MCWIWVGFLWVRYRWEALHEWSLNTKVSDAGLFYMCSKLFSTAQSANSSQSIGILHQLCFQNNKSMLSVNSKTGRFVKLILFAELALPSWLSHILHNGFDSSPPVIEVMIFIPTWPTIRWRMFNIPKRILVSIYMIIASAWKLIAFEYENNENRESNNHTKRLNWPSFKEAPYRILDMSQQP